MNAQQQGYSHQYPPPNQYPYQFPYPAPPQGVASQQQQLPSYQYNPQPVPQQQQVQQPQAPYFRTVQGTPQSVPQTQPPKQTPKQSSKQTPKRKGKQNARNTSNARPQNDPGASRAEATSPEMDDFDTSLMNALRADNHTDQQPQQEPDGVDDANEPIYNLPPPPENTYPTEAELEKAMHAWSLEHGYEMVRRASKKNAAGKMYKRYYHCSKHGMKGSKLPPTERKRANRKSNRIGCQMSLASVAVDPTNPDAEWQIRHRKTHHNHPANEAVSLAGHRRRARTGGVEKAVDGLFSIGTSTQQVLQFLARTQEKGLFTRTDVANMKLKWKKHGTCAYKGTDDDQEKNGSAQTSGLYPGAEMQVSGGAQGEEGGAPPMPQMDLTSSTLQHRPQQQEPLTETANGVTTANNFLRGNRPGRPNAVQAAATREILDELRSFQNEHIIPQRLQLISSSVEILAQSSCGTGESYKSIHVLSHPSDWLAFRNAMIEAAMKENTWDVLSGNKIEPLPPFGGELNVDIDVWNEYVKQLAIWNRRNSLLLSALWTHLAPNLRSRVQSYRKASDIWDALEDLCAPRGSETAFRLFLDLHNISLAESADLKDYIHRLTSTYEHFCKLKLNTSPPILNAAPKNLSPVRTGGEAVTEEMVCMLFLRNLGPEWRRWVEGLVATNNIGGFGTGERLGLKELGKRAEAYQRMQERAL